MNSRFGSLIRCCRRQRRITQARLAEMLGVCQQTVSEWERGERPMPPAHVDDVCDMLGMPREALQSEPAAAPIRRFRRKKRVRMRPAYPLGASIEHMTTLGPFYHHLHQRVKEKLSAVDYETIANAYPRDSRHELAFLFHLLAQESIVSHAALGHLRFRLNVLHDTTWEDGQDLVQPVVVWEKGDERMVVFGQPWLNLPWDPPVRPDFLVWYRKKGEAGYWLFVEIDDDSHRDKSYRDQARTLAINLVGLRYEDHTLSNPTFFQRLLRDVRGLRQAARERRRERRRRARLLIAKRHREAGEKRSRS